ncbi:hypothetical protein LTR96_009921 [Exophiala xenobiotica]|nr:hypothetical protein LTR96_009921 [Exophiala xenobiotica]KAK5337026.1 hypothetical protein LTR98_007333 [Exophiala xenobiotica]
MTSSWSLVRDVMFTIHHLNSGAPQIHPSDAPQEPTGPVASDSLAAESLKNHGGFAENAHAAASRQPGSSSTLNNTDTSAAKVLPPAADGTQREKQYAPATLSLGADEGKAGASDFGASTVGSGSATGPDPNIKSGSAAATGGSGNTSTGGGPTAGAGIRPHVDAAPGYTSTVTGAAAPSGTYKPKGANLEDADATESMPKPKTFIGDVGGSHDPGRIAEQNFEARNTGPAEQVSSSGTEGGAQRQVGSGAVGEQGGSFGVLGSERA